MGKTITNLPSQEELNKLWHNIDPELPDYSFEWSLGLKMSGGNVDFRKRLVRLSARVHLQYGIEETIKTLKHEAAHVMAYLKHGNYAYQHNKGWFWYYMGKYSAPRYAPTLCASIRTAPLKLEGHRRNKGIEFDPIGKTFKQRR